MPGRTPRFATAVPYRRRDILILPFGADVTRLPQVPALIDRRLESQQRPKHAYGIAKAHAAVAVSVGVLVG